MSMAGEKIVPDRHQPQTHHVQNFARSSIAGPPPSFSNGIIDQIRRFQLSAVCGAKDIQKPA